MRTVARMIRQPVVLVKYYKMVLKAWAMRLFGQTEHQAHDWLEGSWDRIDRVNDRFVRILREQWA